MDQLSLGIQYAGNIAADGGVQFEELVAALGAMSNAGIKSGSTLGTGMRALIADLENPSKKLVAWLEKVGLTVEDVNLRTHSLGEVLESLKSHGYDSAAAMGTLELRAAAAYSALSNNQDVYAQMLQGIQGTMAAQEAATTQMDSFSAQWTRLTNGVTAFTSVVGATQSLHVLIDRDGNRVDGCWKAVREDHAAHNNEDGVRLNHFKRAVVESGFGDMVFGVVDEVPLHVLGRHPRNGAAPVVEVSCIGRRAAAERNEKALQVVAGRSEPRRTMTRRGRKRSRLTNQVKGSP